MKFSLIISCVLAYCGGEVFGQTNIPPSGERPTFAVPGPQLRMAVPEVTQAATTATTEQPLIARITPSHLSGELAITSRRGISDERFLRRLSEAGYLQRPEARPDDLVSRTMDAIFQPEIVRMGKTTLAFSPITAIKRRSLLPLLNPVPLVVTW